MSNNRALKLTIIIGDYYVVEDNSRQRDKRNTIPETGDMCTNEKQSPHNNSRLGMPKDRKQKA